VPEPTTGLDATAALDIGRTLHMLSKQTLMPVLCALQQPSNELWRQFDKVILLTRGQIAYWGPRTVSLPFSIPGNFKLLPLFLIYFWHTRLIRGCAGTDLLPYLANLGFTCPPSYADGEFVCELLESPEGTNRSHSRILGYLHFLLCCLPMAKF
jgi:hypothetical protein